jgi:hypothetical protein
MAITTTFGSSGAPTVFQAAKFSRLITVGAILMVFASSRALCQGHLLGPVRLDPTGIEDSTAYFVYRYRIVNPATSQAGVAGIRIDLSATPGTGRMTLPFSGQVAHGGGGPADHVPVGGIGPEHWWMQVIYDGRFVWNAADIGAVANDSGLSASADSAAPGATLEGLGLRSPYLPGIRTFHADPTFQSCCSKPIPNSEEREYPTPGDFRVRGLSIGPTVRPQDMSLDILAADLRQVCGNLRWITDQTACQRLRTNLDQAAAAFRQHDHVGLVTALGAFLDVLEQEHGAGGAVNDNAYWLLQVNGDYLRAHL